MGLPLYLYYVGVTLVQIPLGFEPSFFLKKQLFLLIITLLMLKKVPETATYYTVHANSELDEASGVQISGFETYQAKLYTGSEARFLAEGRKDAG